MFHIKTHDKSRVSIWDTLRYHRYCIKESILMMLKIDVKTPH